MISIAIVEDDARLRRSFELLLNESPGYQCVGTYATAEEALTHIPKQPPRVVLMDINLPDLSGIECTARLKKMLPSVSVLIFTVYSDNDKIFKALRAGASGYLLKRTPPEMILQAITDVIQGGSPMSSEIARKVVETFQQPAPSSAEPVELSRRELEVLDLLCKGFANKEIAVKLSVSLATVRFHLTHIYEKLHVRSRTEAALKFHDMANPTGS